ncbi:MAG: VWA domain-containing protein [Candidatus Competibacteraceae bacterium]|nr:VWA domain-containing protein [Candidatus Competibacteraceae bacterium]MCB1815219.1 VWA domain-containing protein [Candidatus Competibacteraceae bacterium]
MTSKDKQIANRSSTQDVAKFLGQARALTQTANAGRLIFALDATASRQPTWDTACELQAEMFNAAATAANGKLLVQLCWYRGIGDFGAAEWTPNAAGLIQQMAKVYCVGGRTQIARVLNHALQESRQQRIHSLVFVGDCMEEDPGHLYELAGQLKILRIPAFMFHEGREPLAASVFREIAALSGGAYCPFDTAAADQLRQLLRGVGAFSAGGLSALQQLAQREGGQLLKLVKQIDR